MVDTIDHLPEKKPSRGRRSVCVKMQLIRSVANIMLVCASMRNVIVSRTTT